LTLEACLAENGEMRKWLLLFLLLLGAPAFAADEALSPAANAAFLAGSAGKPGTIVRPSGLQYRILRSGAGRRPGGSDVVRLAYKVTLINGTVVDSTTPVLPAALGMANVSMAGLAEALSLMHAGDRWQLVLPANLALGSKGAANGAIPPNQTLLFDLTLISAAPPVSGQEASENPFSLWGNGRENGAAFTIRP
jgi:FKBP-type peptidyl-prolyl cis-trans isomerase